jgi:hypothetical protein
MKRILALLLVIASVNASAAGYLKCQSARSLTIDGPRGTMTIGIQNYTVDPVKGKIAGAYTTVDPQPLVLQNPKDTTVITADPRGTTVMTIKDDLTFTLVQAGTEIIWGTCVK